MADPAAGSPVQYGWDTDKVPSAIKGFRLEGYTVERELGRGGMGQVYLAREQVSQRLVAIKVLPALALTEKSRNRFEREAELLARLQHPNVVGAHTWGRTDEAFYLVTEYVEGEHLDEVARPLPLPARMGLLEQVARAVAAIHAEGIVHRDLKPSNLLVDRAGVVKLIDFGVSTADDVDRLTKTGQFIGTPLYAPPERFAGDRSAQGPTDDVWALGAIGFELLTGQRPYPRGDGNVYKHIMRLQEPAPLASSVNPDVPLPLAQVMARALEPVPRDRYPHALAFLEGVQAAQHPGDHPGGGGVLWRTGLLLAAVVGAAFVLAVAQRERDRDVDPAPTRSATPVADRQTGAALRAGLDLFARPSVVNDDRARPALAKLRDSLDRSDPRATLLADRVVEALSAEGCEWERWGRGVLIELARTGARPSERLLAESLCEHIWWGTQRLGADRLDVETFRECLVALVRLDVDIDGMHSAFPWGDDDGPRPQPGDSPELIYVKLRAQLRKRRAPDRDPDRAALLEHVLDGEALGPTTRARGICEGARSHRNPDRRLTLIERARELDPGNLHVALEHARSLLWAGRLREGEAALPSAWEVWLQVHGQRDASVHEVVNEAELCARALMVHGKVEAATALIDDLLPRYEKLPVLYRVIQKRLERYQPGGEEVRAEDTRWVREGIGRRW